MALPVDVEATFIDPSNPADPASAPVYSGVELRRADAALVGGAGDTADPLKVRGGIVRHASNSLAVTVDGSDVVTIQPGAAVIPGNAVASGGAYRAALPVVTTGALAARDATNSRIDLVAFRALDPDAVGTHPARTGRIEIITGTPSGTPAVPALPSLAVELARITVPASGGGSASVDATRRVFVSPPGGRLVVASAAALPAGGVLWEQAIALDTGQTYTWTGAAWDAGVWKPYAMAWTAVTTNPSIGDGSLVAAYQQVGKTVHGRFAIIFGPGTSRGSGSYRFGLPVPAASAYSIWFPIGTGVVRDLSPAARYACFVATTDDPTVALLMTVTNGSIVAESSPITLANTDQIFGSFTYQAA